MKFPIKILAVVLCAQIIVSMIINGATPTHTRETTTLLSTTLDGIDEIQIATQDQNVHLLQSGDQWKISEYGDMPVELTLINLLLDKLNKASVDWPIAQSKDAAIRLEVSEENAQKTISFSRQGKKLTSLYLGTSPGYRKIYIRKDDASEIYITELAQHDVPDEPEYWMNKSVLSVKGEITAVTTHAFALKKTTVDDNDQPNWALTSSLDGEPYRLDSNKVQAWVERFNALLVSQLIVNDNQYQRIVIQNPISTIHLTTTSGTTIRELAYAFYTMDETLYVKQFGDSPVFEIASQLADPILKATITQFAPTTQSEPDRSAALTSPEVTQ
ncbi:DUF4340 domain-containing protein [Teredinibacter purpureus]|uniref:DUF4340 domain-containing protein n=1 Tax=Teredinibacter purpureus TaxID=2731756 RepID=UPI0005F80219|nr:DUF4340 domain-containing protein [Teredinibacter purpureus]